MSIVTNMVVATMVATTSITAATGTRGKMLVDHLPGGWRPANYDAAHPVLAGVVASGGGRIIEMGAASTDTTARDLLIYRGQTLTTHGQAVNAPGNLAIATSSTITSQTGDLRLDGWTVGDSLMVFGRAPRVSDYALLPGSPDINAAGIVADLASAGVLVVVTAVSANQLTVSGTALTAVNLTGCRLIRVAQLARVSVVANSGNAAATASTDLLGSSMVSQVAALTPGDRGLSHGPTNSIIVAAGTAVTALPCRIDIAATVLAQ